MIYDFAGAGGGFEREDKHLARLAAGRGNVLASRDDVDQSNRVGIE
jgi:hypothetical protein